MVGTISIANRMMSYHAANCSPPRINAGNREGTI